MSKNGFSTFELLITATILGVIFTAVIIVGNAGMNASFTTDYNVRQLSNARNALTRMSNDINTSNAMIMAVKNCGNDDNCNGKKLLFKIPVADQKPVAGSLYTPDGRVKYGALDKNGQPQQYCYYEYMAIKNPPQLVRNSVCDPTLKCGDGVCDNATESKETCPIDCGTCGDGVCTPTRGENADNCIDCVVCGDGICSPGEHCHEAKECWGDCGACSQVCGNGVCEPGETCTNCPSDCGVCACGNGLCEPGETCTNCPNDCGVCILN